MIPIARFLPIFVVAGAVASAGEADSARSGAEFAVVYWYDRADPIGSFKSRAYDLRKHEYHEAEVGAWLEMMARDFPRYAAYVREVDLDRMPGQTDREKLTAASTGELKPFIDATLSVLRARGRPIGRPGPGLARPGPGLTAPIGAAEFHPRYAPPGYTTPIPYPYPRPHP